MKPEILQSTETPTVNAELLQSAGRSVGAADVAAAAVGAVAVAVVVAATMLHPGWNSARNGAPHAVKRHMEMRRRIQAPAAAVVPPDPVFAEAFAGFFAADNCG